MSMYATEIRKALLAATLLVSKAISKEISIREFKEEYGDFYYYAALDGHEADEMEKTVLDKLTIPIQLHEKVQTQIVDITYLGAAQKQEYMDAGRIDEEEARKRLTEIGTEFDIVAVIKTLEG